MLNSYFISSLLKASEIKRIEASEDIIYVVDKNFTLCGFNRAWISFAKQNNGEGVLKKYGVGTSIISALPEVLKDYYISLYRKALDSGERVDNQYDCSSAETYRKYHQSIYPLSEKKGLLISNHCLIEKTNEEKAEHFASKHRNKYGIITQCCHCRRVKNYSKKNQWDWIPELISQTHEKISHGICWHCISFYYPSLALKHPHG